MIHDHDFPFKVDHGILNETFEIHSHDFFELFIIKKGSAIHTINGNKQQVSAGDVFVINNRAIYHGFEDPIQMELYNFIFEPDYFFKQQHDLFQMEGYQSLFVLEPIFSSKKGYKHFIHIPFKKLMELNQISESILNEFQAKKPGYKTIIKSKFLELVAKLSRAYVGHPSIKKPHKVEGLGKAVAFIEKNYTSPIHNDDLAKIASLSTRQFLRTFKECYHCSPVHYIINLRIKHACNLLEKQDLSLKEIAFDCGFNDANYFSRLFSAYIGKSPSNYRKELFI